MKEDCLLSRRQKQLGTIAASFIILLRTVNLIMAKREQTQLKQIQLLQKLNVDCLIRSFEDRGVLMMGDARLVSKPYGKTFIQSLPPFPRTRELDDVREFFAKVPA